MQRAVEPELLDELPSSDDRARGSRRDLRRINAIMGNAPVAARALLTRGDTKALTSLAELGAGDGTFALAVVRRLGASTAARRVMLVDRQPCVAEATRRAFESLSWSVQVVQADAMEWLDRGVTDTLDVTISNLFLHHFKNGELRALLRSSARRTKCFIACEPLRSRLALCAATMVPLIGCNRVTLHDARISVRAGFRGQELSALWPEKDQWRLREHPARLFTHHFVAQHA
jgi:hypothetical protein